jgi:protein-tyrosine phosphatase
MAGGAPPSRLVDLHCHVLPAVDDGVRDEQEAVALAARAAAGGVAVIVATPHVRVGGAFDFRSIPDRVERLNAVLRRAAVAVEVRPGAEVDWEAAASLTDEELASLALGGRGRLLLVETPARPEPAFADAVEELVGRGFRPVLAHPERSRLDLDVAARLVARGALAQVTAVSLLGAGGERIRTRAHALLQRGIAHFVASDAHGVDQRLAAFVALEETVAVRDPSLAVRLRAFAGRRPAEALETGGGEPRS